jgi:hypothetical protein
MKRYGIEMLTSTRAVGWEKEKETGFGKLSSWMVKFMPLPIFSLSPEVINGHGFFKESGTYDH